MCLSVCGVVCVCVCVLVYVYMMYICVMFLSACTMCGCVHMYTCVQCLCMHVHCAWCVSLVCVVCLIEMYNIPKTIDIALFFQYWYCVLNFESLSIFIVYCIVIFLQQFLVLSLFGMSQFFTLNHFKKCLPVFKACNCKHNYKYYSNNPKRMLKRYWHFNRHIDIVLKPKSLYFTSLVWTCVGV